VIAAGRSLNIEEELVGADGRRHKLLTSKVPHRDHEGRVAGVVGIARDVTDRRRLEQRLQHSHRLESLSALAGGIAHDLDGLLADTARETEQALNTLPPGHAGREPIEKVSKSIAQTSERLRQLRAYSGKGTLLLQPVELGSMVREHLGFLEMAVPEGVRLRAELSPEPTWVEADLGQLQQAFMGLVLNGAEATGAPSSIRVSTGVETLGNGDERFAETMCDAPAPGRYAFVEVQDEGTGISDTLLSRVVDPFFTTKPKGHGLGLSVAFGVARCHKGGLHIDSQPGSGTRVRLILPSARAPKPSA
jgi:signal transduction histidine kinase